MALSKYNKLFNGRAKGKNMTEILTIEEIEKLAYRVWYHKFEEEAKLSLATHKKNVESEFSMLKKYRSEIYNRFSSLISLSKEIEEKVQNCEYAHKKIWEEIKKIEVMYKNIKDAERKISYSMGEPYDKRNIEREHKFDINLTEKVEKIKEND